MESITINVGQQIRALREQQGLSLRALAERCGLSINAISLIERGENSPTVSSLHLLALALQVPITSFFEEKQEQTVVFVEPPTRLRSETNGILLESLGLGLRDQQLEPFLLTVNPGANNLDQPISHPGEELVYCFEGEIVYYVAEQAYRLRAGYSLLFQATQTHCFHNDTTQVARLMLVFQAAQGIHLARPLHLTSTANPVTHSRG